MFNPTLVHEYLALSAKKFPDKAALICGKERWTYQSIDQYSDLLADILRDIGMKRHDRVAIFLDNSIESVISLYAVLKAGGTFVMVNNLIKAKKLSYILQDCGATMLITQTNKLHVVSAACNDFTNTCKIIWIGNSSSIPRTLSACSLFWNEIFQNVNTMSELSQKKKNNGANCNIIALDLAALIYTSGSTADPKGVMSSHHNMISAAQSIIQYLKNTRKDIILNVLPLSFDYGLYQIIMSFMFGGTVILEKSFLYPIKVLEYIEKEKVTGFPILPTIAAFLLKMQNLHKFNFSSLRYMTNTGSALPEEHIRKLRALFPHVKLYSMYGLTECKRVSYLPPKELDQRISSVGKAMPNCEALIFNDEGKEVKPREVGELVIRGANVMCGYWHAPELTAKTFRKGNHLGETLLYTGDLFRKDEGGFLYFIGRKDDLIKTKGERVGPKEIENALCEIKGIIETAVIGVPDDILGQAIKAFIVLEPECGLTEKEILKYCSDRLEIFMIPKYIEFVEELPKTPNGKIDKKALNRYPGNYK